MRYRNRLLALVCAAALLVLLVPGAAASGAAISVESQTVTASSLPGEVKVKLTLTGNPGILGCKLTIKYDKRLTLQAIENGTALDGLDFTAPGNLSVNPINLLWTKTDAVKGNGTLVTLTFAVPAEVDTYAITPSCIPDDFFDNDFNNLPLTIVPGAIEVKGASSGGGLSGGGGSSGGGSSAVETPAVPADKFKDVARNAWYREAVNFVVKQGLMVGTGEDTFEPDKELSRAMVVQVLYNKENKPAVTSANPFTDVPAREWYYNAVRWGADRKVVSGFGGGLFKPEDPVTVEQVAVILWNYSGAPESSARIGEVGSHSDWAVNALRWCAEKGILNAVPFTDASENATRAQTAMMLTNYLK